MLFLQCVMVQDLHQAMMLHMGVNEHINPKPRVSLTRQAVARDGGSNILL